MPTDALAERLEACYTGAVFDVLRSRGIPNQVLPNQLRPLDVERSLAGRVYTVSGRPAPHASGHETLLAWTGLLSRAPAGSVVVCQPNDSSVAHMGELSAEALTLRGVRGYVVDGGCRDSQAILKLGFPVFCKYFTPVDVVGRWLADSFGEPITIGGVTCSTGDYLLADRDGIVVIPEAIAADVVAETESKLATENLVRKAILEGVDPQHAYLEHGVF